MKKKKSELLWIDPEIIAKELHKAGIPQQMDPDDPMLCDYDGWSNTIMDTLESFYQLETKVGEALERIRSLPSSNIS